MNTLIERLEALTAPSREVDALIAISIGKKATLELGDTALGNHRFVPVHFLSYTASIDSAITLVPEKYAFGCGKGTNEPSIDGWAWCGPDEGPYAWGATPAIALCIASLRARETTNA